MPLKSTKPIVIGKDEVEKIKNDLELLRSSLESSKKDTTELFQTYEGKLERQEDRNKNITIVVVVATGIIVMLGIWGTVIQSKQDNEFYLNVSKERTDELLKIQELQLRQEYRMNSIESSLRNQNIKY